MAGGSGFEALPYDRRRTWQKPYMDRLPDEHRNHHEDGRQHDQVFDDHAHIRGHRRKQINDVL